MKKTLAIILALVMCSALLFTACSEEKNELNETIVATVNGVNVSQADFNLMYKLGFDSAAQYSQQEGEGWFNVEIDDKGTTRGDSIKTQAMDAVTELVVIEKLAKENGIKVDSAKVEEQVRNIKEQQGGESGYSEFLKTYRTTDEAVTKYVERVMLYEDLSAKLSEEGGAAYISDESVLPEFEGNYMRVQHVLVSTQPGTDADGKETPAKSEEEALKLANEVIAKLDGGADFEALIEEYDEDPGMEKGQYYTFTSGMMVAEFEEASRNLQIGEYTKEPVKTDYGYHIIKKYELTTDCDEFKQLKQEKSQAIVGEMIEKKVKEAKVTKKDDAIKKYLDAWLKELGVNVNAPKTPYAAPQTSEMPIVEGAPEGSEITVEEVPAEEVPAEEAPAAE